jgi:hypothetical protein
VPNLARMYTLGLDTIAGAKLLQLKFGPAGNFQPNQAVLHEGRRARFIGMDGGAAIIRYGGDIHPAAVPLETLSPPCGETGPVASRMSLGGRSSPGQRSRTVPGGCSGRAPSWSSSLTARRRLTIV